MGAADVGGSSNPTPSSTPPTSQQRGTPAASGSGRKPPLPSYNSPAVVLASPPQWSVAGRGRLLICSGKTRCSPLTWQDSRETSDSPAVGACMTAERAASPFRPAAWAPSPSPAAGPEPNGALSELEAIREKQKSMGFDPDAPVPLKSSPSVSSDDDGLAGGELAAVTSRQPLCTRSPSTALCTSTCEGVFLLSLSILPSCHSNYVSSRLIATAFRLLALSSILHNLCPPPASALCLGEAAAPHDERARVPLCRR